MDRRHEGFGQAGQEHPDPASRSDRFGSARPRDHREPAGADRGRPRRRQGAQARALRDQPLQPGRDQGDTCGGPPAVPVRPDACLLHRHAHQRTDCSGVGAGRPEGRDDHGRPGGGRGCGQGRRQDCRSAAGDRTDRAGAGGHREAEGGQLREVEVRHHQAQQQGPVRGLEQLVQRLGEGGD